MTNPSADDQDSTGPSGVFDQSNTRMRLPISPGGRGERGGSSKAAFRCEPWDTSPGQQPVEPLVVETGRATPEGVRPLEVAAANHSGIFHSPSLTGSCQLITVVFHRSSIRPPFMGWLELQKVRHGRYTDEPTRRGVAQTGENPMVTIDIRFDDSALKIRRFGEFDRWTILHPGEHDQRLTGWSYDELRRLGEGVWQFPAAIQSASTSPFEAGVLHGEPV
jgi:hypothetical protein